MKTSPRARPIAPIIFRAAGPPRRRTGGPRSSSAPGASPTNIRRACGRPRRARSAFAWRAAGISCRRRRPARSPATRESTARGFGRGERCGSVGGPGARAARRQRAAAGAARPSRRSAPAARTPASGCRARGRAARAPGGRGRRPRPRGRGGLTGCRAARARRTSSRMRPAISVLGASGTAMRRPSRWKISTWLVSVSKPAPGTVTSLATTRSRFFSCSFSVRPRPGPRSRPRSPRAGSPRRRADLGEDVRGRLQLDDEAPAPGLLDLPRAGPPAGSPRPRRPSRRRRRPPGARGPPRASPRR